MSEHHMRELYLVTAAIRLAQCGAAAGLLPIPNSSPQMFVAFGTADDLRELAEGELVRPFVSEDSGLPPVKPAPARLVADVDCVQGQCGDLAGCRGTCALKGHPVIVAQQTLERLAMDAIPPPGAVPMCGECRKPANTCACLQTTDGPGEADAAPDTNFDERGSSNGTE